MIRHDDRPFEFIPLPVEKMQRPGEDAAHLRPPQEARAVARIQPVLHPVDEFALIFRQHARRPRLRIQRQPAFAVLLPFAELRRRQRIPQPPGDEISAARLLPMRQIPPVLRDVRRLIERFHKLKRWRGLSANVTRAFQPVNPTPPKAHFFP